MTRGRPFKDIPKTNKLPENGSYYTIAEAVELTGLHRHTLQNWLRTNRIKGKLIGRSWRIYKDELYEGKEV